MRELLALATIVVALVSLVLSVRRLIDLGDRILGASYPRRYVRLLGRGTLAGAVATIVVGAAAVWRQASAAEVAADPWLLLALLAALLGLALGGALVGACCAMVLGHLLGVATRRDEAAGGAGATTRRPLSRR